MPCHIQPCLIQACRAVVTLAPALTLAPTLTLTLTLTLTPTQACRAVGGLLAYLQRTDVSSSMSISKLERCRIDPC